MTYLRLAASGWLLHFRRGCVAVRFVDKRFEDINVSCLDDKPVSLNVGHIECRDQVHPFSWESSNLLTVFWMS
jgi:hypothetical protein